MRSSRFFFLGNTIFRGLSQREHALAATVAQRGNDVTFIEGMPSLAARARSLSQRLFSPSAIEEGAGELQQIPNLRILIPPVVPTFFRSSLTPFLDRILFQYWFRKKTESVNWSEVIVVVTFPYWWYGFIDRKLLPARLIMYDVCDALEMPSRNSRALNRMIRAERKLLSDVDYITYSAHEMKSDLGNRFPGRETHHIPNAVSTQFAETAGRSNTRGGRKRIGYVGSLDTRWVDEDLVLTVARRFPECEIIVRASMGKSAAKRLADFPNTRIVGFMAHGALAGLLSTLDVALIPFIRNEITRVVNPLKLYEYAAAGIPIVAMYTEELAHYTDILYLAGTKEEFVLHVEAALKEDGSLKKRRQEFAAANTWEHRVDALLEAIENKLAGSRK